MDRCPISGDLGVDHLTFEGEGGRIGKCKNFLSLASGAGTIFLGHVACLFVFYCKGFAGNFFSNLPLLPSKIKWSTP